MEAGKPAPRLLNILLAEDDPQDITKLNDALARDGVAARFFIVRDGDEVVDYLRGEGAFAERGKFPFPDLLVLNLHMPRMSGLDVLSWLNQHPPCAQLPTVMLSGSSDEAAVEEAYRRGVNGYLRKPSTPVAFSRLLRNLASYWQMTERPSAARACRDV
jgi:CheY-like chemotaxis protein